MARHASPSGLGGLSQSSERKNAKLQNRLLVGLLCEGEQSWGADGALGDDDYAAGIGMQP
jgi:hypothetical protein